nr:MAG TPA: hypothetical protein [Caudoviricetes sp.]
MKHKIDFLLLYSQSYLPYEWESVLLYGFPFIVLN